MGSISISSMSPFLTYSARSINYLILLSLGTYFY